MIIAFIISIITIVINNRINVNCNIFPTDIADLKCVSLKDKIIAITRRIIIYNTGYVVFLITTAIENFKFKNKKKIIIFSHLLINAIEIIANIL